MRSDAAEDAYFDIYQTISDRGEYLQSSLDTRHNLPDLWVVAAVTSVLTALLNGYLTRFGEMASDATMSSIKLLVRKLRSRPDEPDIPDGESAINATRLLLQLMRESEQAEASTRLAVLEDCVRRELVRMGFPPEHAIDIARDVAARLIEEIEH